MAKEPEAHGEIGVGEVEVTIDVVPGPVHAKVATLWGRGPVRATVAAVALAAAVIAGVVVVESPRDRPSTVASRSHVLSPPRSAVMSRFGIRSHCVRRAIVAGSFARVDFDRGPACGAAGNHVTLILRRVGRAWMAAMDATGSRCPTIALPPAVLASLHFCRSN